MFIKRINNQLRVLHVCNIIYVSYKECHRFFVRKALTCNLSLANNIFERKGLILRELKTNRKHQYSKIPYGKLGQNTNKHTCSNKEQQMTFKNSHYVPFCNGDFPSSRTVLKQNHVVRGFPGYSNCVKANPYCKSIVLYMEYQCYVLKFLLEIFLMRKFFRILLSFWHRVAFFP